MKITRWIRPGVEYKLSDEWMAFERVKLNVYIQFGRVRLVHPFARLQRQQAKLLRRRQFVVETELKPYPKDVTQRMIYERIIRNAL